MINLLPCPVCNNSELSIGTCEYQNKVIAYHVYCSICHFTGRSYKIKIKALNKWNSLVRQSSSINKE